MKVLRQNLTAIEQESGKRAFRPSDIKIQLCFGACYGSNCSGHLRAADRLVNKGDIDFYRCPFREFLMNM
jgi:hypothetical protein